MYGREDLTGTEIVNTDFRAEVTNALKHRYEGIPTFRRLRVLVTKPLPTCDSGTPAEIAHPRSVSPALKFMYEKETRETGRDAPERNCGGWGPIFPTAAMDKP
jgi:hypothetical protein